jgi:ECF transporter S component (folate family)
MKKTLTTKTITYLAFFIALNIILVRFLAIKPLPTLRLDLGFFPIFIASTLFGPFLGAITAGLSDILGMFINGGGVPLNPLMTINTMVSGLIYGFFLYKKSDGGMKKAPFLTIILCVATQIIVVELILQSIALYYMYSQSKSIFAVLSTRYIKALIMFPIQVFSIKYSFDYLIPLISPNKKGQ